MCGGCRVSVGGHSKFVCVDGPEFDGHQVDFAELAARLTAYASRKRSRAIQCKATPQLPVSTSPAAHRAREGAARGAGDPRATEPGCGAEPT